MPIRSRECVNVLQRIWSTQTCDFQTQKLQPFALPTRPRYYTKPKSALPEVLENATKFGIALRQSCYSHPATHSKSKSSAPCGRPAQPAHTLAAHRCLGAMTLLVWEQKVPRSRSADQGIAHRACCCPQCRILAGERVGRQAHTVAGPGRSSMSRFLALHR